jgi:hypothetical protein
MPQVLMTKQFPGKGKKVRQKWRKVSGKYVWKYKKFYLCMDEHLWGKMSEVWFFMYRMEYEGTWMGFIV